MSIQIPNQWFKYHDTFANFITYFGEVYFGIICLHPNFNDRFFIVQKDKNKILNDLKPEERTLEKYQELGREIKDVNVIKCIIDDQIGTDIQFLQPAFHGEKFKRMFVFGAAASTYCVFGDNSTKFRESHLSPPIGTELFSEKYSSIINQYDGVKLSLPFFESKNHDIEACFQEEWEQVKSTYSPGTVVNHINTQFYLQHLFQTISRKVVDEHYRSNLYSLFTSKLKKLVEQNPKERISIASFNYDTILDQFITRVFDQPFEEMNHYINWDNQNVLLFKPHGSCNWGWKIQDKYLKEFCENGLARTLYAKKIEFHTAFFDLIGTPQEVIAQNSWGHYYSNDPYLRGKFSINKNLIEVVPSGVMDSHFPALLLPYRDKDELTMPYDHSECMKYLMEDQIEELYLIGWKGNEDLFNKQFGSASKLKKVIIVNPDAETVKINVTKANRAVFREGVEVTTINSFEDFVLKHMDDLVKKIENNF